MENRDFFVDTLGGMITEQIVLDSGEIAGTWTTFTNKGYDAVWTKDRPARPAGCTTSPSPSTAATTSSAPPTSPSSTASTSRPGRTSTRSSRASSSTSGSRPATGSSWTTRLPGSSSRPTGSRSTGPRPSAPRARPGACKTIDTFHTHGTPPVRRREVTLRIAVLGLGEAGSEIARDLVAAGADVRGYDPLADRRRRGPAARQRGRRGGRRRPGAQRQQLPRRHDGAGERARRRCAPARCGPTSTPPVPG